MLKKTATDLTDLTTDEIAFAQQALQGSGVSFDQFCRF